MNIIPKAKEIFREQGWRVHEAKALDSAGLDFDLAAESDKSLVFLKITPGSQLGEVANRLAGEIASITLREGAGAKAWEAYLILLVSEGYEDHLADVQALHYDFTFCRRVVLDLSETLEAEDPEAKLMTDLAFLFPLGIPTAPSIADIRQILATHLAERGISAELAQDLATHSMTPSVDAFDGLLGVARTGRHENRQRGTRKLPQLPGAQDVRLLSGRSDPRGS